MHTLQLFLATLYYIKSIFQFYCCWKHNQILINFSYSVNERSDMQNGSVTQVSSNRPPAFLGPPQPIPPGSGNGFPANPPFPQLNQSRSGTSSPAMAFQQHRPAFAPAVPNYDRNTVTPPNVPPNFRPASLPTSLNTSPSRTPVGSAHSTSHLNGPPQLFRPPVDGVNGMPRFAPPQLGARAPSQPGFQPSSSQPSFPPQPTSQPFRPPRPLNQPTFPPKSASQPGFPTQPTNQPGAPQSSQLGSPPISQPGSAPASFPGPPQFRPPPMMFNPNTNGPTNGPPIMADPNSQPPVGGPPQVSQPNPPPPPTGAGNFSRLGPAGLKAKRPVPSYNINQPSATPVPGNLPPNSLPMSTAQPSGPVPASPMPPPGMQPSQHMQPGMPGMAMAPQPGAAMDDASQRMRQMSLSDRSHINLMEHRSIFPKDEKLTCLPPLPPDLITHNKYPEHFCSTLNVVPSSSSVLNKLKVPFGLVIQPFKDLGDEVPVVTPPIPRCKVCRTYVNPYVQLNDGARRWKCNICARLNDMPADYFYGEDGRRVPFNIDSRPELNSALVEYIAPSEYTTRPPQAAVYLYLIDVSIGAVQTGMVKMACKVLEEELDSIPGDSRRCIGIICFSSKLHYFNLHKNSGQPQMLVVADLDEPFIPTIDELIVNIKEEKQKIKDLLSLIPTIFADSKDPDCAVGPALKAAKELIFRFGGRLTLMISRSPSIGDGTIKKRGDTAKAEGLSLAPLTDFYKTLSLECTQKQVTVDLFMFPNDNIDVPTVSTISQFSSGSVYYYPQYHYEKNPLMAEKFVCDFRHYVTRPIAFEAVLRIRCTSGVNIHSFFGNCFVRAHDLIALANVSPDVAFGAQISIDDNLHESKLAIFQSALLFTSSKGDRRIRVHTLALPITSDPQTIYSNLNIDASVALLAKMAVEKANSASLGDAREALQYAVIDPLIRYRSDYCPSAKGSGQLAVPVSQRLLPLLVSSILKSKAFRLQNVSVDDRYFSMLQYKTLPIEDVMLMIYPRLFSLHNLAETWTDKNAVPPRLPLTAEKLTRQGAFLLQTHEHFIIWIGRHVTDIFVNSVYNAASFEDLPDLRVGLNHHDNAISDLIHDLIALCSKVREAPITIVSVREDKRAGHMFLQHLVEDRSDGQISYYEFLQKIQQQVG